MILQINVPKRLLFLIIIVIHSLIWSQQVLITEIMYDLDGTDSPNEFVELFNPSETDSIDLTSWTIKDRSSEDALIDSGFGLILPPLSYGLILEGDYDLNYGLYQSTLPGNTILIKVDDASIGNGLSVTDSLFLQDSTGIVIDAIGWEDWAQDGYSLERIRYHLPNSPSNWIQSLDSLGTPGRENSVLPDSIDLMIHAISLSDSIITQTETTTLIGQIVNIGLNTSSPELQFFINGEFVTNEYLGSVDELDTLDFEMELGPFNSGEHMIHVTLISEGDSSIFNNSDSIVVGVRYPFRTLLLNEFMSQPHSGFGEFVEIVNNTNNPLNLEGWHIADYNANLSPFPQSTIESNQFGIIASDSTYLEWVPNDVPYLIPTNGFPTLNNSGDAIRIYDPFGTPIDSLIYNTEWNLAQGASQEKMYVDDSSHIAGNWYASTDENGHTIGTINSVTPSSFNGTIINSHISYSPEIPTEMDEVILIIPIKNSGISSFEGTLLISDSGEIIGQTNFLSGNLGDTTLVELGIGVFPSGRHSITIDLSVDGDEQLDDNLAEILVLVRYPFGTILLNEFLSAPNNDQSEFVECVAFNEISLLGWGISDNQKAPQLFDSLFIESNEYLVILQDSTLFEDVNMDAHTIVLSSFPTLNNSADGIYIFDHTGSIIDSLIYDITWPMESERSTEKKRPSFVSNDVQSWDIADYDVGFTLGYENSQMIQNTDGTILQDLITYSPLPPFPDSVVTLSVPVINNGIEAFLGSITVEISDIEVGDASIPYLNPGDTVTVLCPIIAPESGGHSVTIILDIPNDSNAENDIASILLSVRYPFGSLLINEFLPLPDSSQSEFVEIIPTSPIQLNGWSIQDASGSKGYFNDTSVSPYSYIVVTSDSSFSIPDTSYLLLPDGGLPSLNNVDETIFIMDHTKSIIDSIHYSESWDFMDGRSLEKYRLNDVSNESKNWGISVGDAQQTPGVQNSIYFSELPPKGTLQLSPNPFSPDGDGIDDIVYLTYSLPFESAAIRWEIFDVTGRKIATPYYNYYVGQNGQLSWDGSKQNGETSRIGIYIMKLTFQDQATTKSWESVKTIVLAKRL